MTAGLTTRLLYVMRFSEDISVVSLLLRIPGISPCWRSPHWRAVCRKMLLDSSWHSWYVFNRPGYNTISRDDVFGTPAYTATEMLTGESYGLQVGPWAFDVKLYELITGNVTLAPLRYLN